MTQVDDERGSLDNTDFIKASEPFSFFKLISILSNKEIIVRRKRRKI